ncbi:MAG TPA: furin, partial [Rhodocyclaceae bacterium]|nr:furin [Rhodocyclaceae bacterium]
GNDTYIVDAPGDVVVELPGQGADLVKSAIDYTLGSNLEYLMLTGTAATAASGNAGDNLIRGNAGDNLIQGAGGNDNLEGGGGLDVLQGGEGTDVLRGAGFNAVLDGGAGNDTLWG